MRFFDVENNLDYYSFGMLKPERNGGANYRYGYQGSEKDNEVKGEGNSYTTHFRQLDPRLGRWLTIDPKASSLLWQSPYCSMDNNPVWHNDPLGDDVGYKKFSDRVKVGVSRVFSKRARVNHRIKKDAFDMFIYDYKSGARSLSAGGSIRNSQSKDAFGNQVHTVNYSYGINSISLYTKTFNRTVIDRLIEKENINFGSLKGGDTQFEKTILLNKGDKLRFVTFGQGDEMSITFGDNTYYTDPNNPSHNHDGSKVDPNYPHDITTKNKGAIFNIEQTGYYLIKVNKDARLKTGGNYNTEWRLQKITSQDIQRYSITIKVPIFWKPKTASRSVEIIKQSGESNKKTIIKN